FASRALFFNSNRAWYGLGTCLGLGMLSKHTMILFLPCLALAILVLPGQRRWLRRSEPYLALLIGLIIFSPNLWWQANHNWMTFRHLLLLTGKGADQGVLRRIGDYIGSQAGLITPLLFLGWTWALFRAGRLAP